MSYPLAPLPKRREEDYECGELLGRGTFVTVYRARELATGRGFAMKVVDRYRCDRLKKTKDLDMEKHCLRRLNHPNIVKLHAWFSDSLWVFVVTDLCLGGELWEVVKTVGLPDYLARHYIAQVLNAVEYLRDAGIVHRDLKAENMMLTELGLVKLIDFGTAKDLENPHIKGAGNQSRSKVFEDYVGTPQFMPPEVIHNKCSDQRSDTWSLGCTIFQMLAGVPPFHAAAEYPVFQRVLAMDLQFPPGINPDARDLVTRMVVKDADARLGAQDLEDIRRHPYFRDVKFDKKYHLRPKPVMTLGDLCLHKIGRGMKHFKEQLEQWPSLPKLAPQLAAVLERMKLSQKWQDDALPPDADVA